MSYMAELARIEQEQAQFRKQSRELAEATLRLCNEAGRLLVASRSMDIGIVRDLNYALEGAEGEARAILAKTVGA